MLDQRCRRERLNKPNAGRPSIDLDEGLLMAMPVRADPLLASMDALGL